MREIMQAHDTNIHYRFPRKDRSQSPSPGNGRSSGSMSSRSNGSPSKVSLSVFYQLIDRRDWVAVVKYLEVCPEASKMNCMSRKTTPPSSPSSSSSSTPRSSGTGNIATTTTPTQGNLPLHEVCKQQPPLHVVNMLLELNEEAVRTHGQYGCLPLHFACSSGASFEVVSLLIEVYPAATRCRDELDDALPLHMAAKWGAPEDILMEILTAHPDGSFLRDASGKTPLDYAKQLPKSEARNYAITALESAPILIATAKAAMARVCHETESRIKGMKDAHAEFVRQLEEMQEEERADFMQCEIQYQNELAAEKERNIELAEMVLELQKLDSIVTSERDKLRKTLETERHEFKARIANQEIELRSILESCYVEGDSNNTIDSVPKGGEQGDSAILQQVASLAAAYKETKTEVAKLKVDLKCNEDTMENLSQVLSKKDEEILQLKIQIQEKEFAEIEEEERRKDLEESHQTTQQELLATKDEMNQLKNLVESQRQQIQTANRMLHVHEGRLESIKNLVASLSYNVETWTNETDNQWNGKTSPHGSTIVEGIETLRKVDSSRQPADLARCFDNNKLLKHGQVHMVLATREKTGSDKFSLGETYDTDISTTRLHDEEDVSTRTCNSSAHSWKHRALTKAEPLPVSTLTAEKLDSDTLLVGEANDTVMSTPLRDDEDMSTLSNASPHGSSVDPITSCRSIEEVL